jgi:retron-type reverse transcriptase
MSCRRRKRNTINALRFEASLLDNLADLGETLSSGTYKPSRSVCFVAKQPKHRAIFAADFRDRVVHHLLVPWIEKIFEPKFIHDSYACRKDKGTHAAVERLKHFMNRVTKGGRVEAWFIQLDIRSFFMSMDREILLGILEKNIRKASISKIPLHPPLLKGETTCKQYVSLDPTLEKGETTCKQYVNLDPTLEKGETTCKQYVSLDPTLEKGGEGGFSFALLRLAETIVRQDCTQNFYKGAPRLLERIPPHKSLFHIPEGKGLPIGNLTSQFFGNVYLNELDQFVKHELKIKFYLRYVDDFILMDTDREQLLALKERIAAFLQERLALELKTSTTLKRVSEGANFLGYVARRDYVLVRNRVVGNLKARLRLFEEEMVERGIKCTIAPLMTHYKIPPHLPLPKGGINPSLAKRGEGRFSEGDYSRIHLRKDTVRQLRQTFASYLGQFKHANSYKLTRSLFENFAYLKDIFTLDDEGRLKPLYEPQFEPATLRGQYKWVMKQYPDFCIFFQVGRFCEFYGEQAERYGKFFGLKIRRETPLTLTPSTPLRACISPKGRGRDVGPLCGFPVRYLKEFKTKVLNAGLPYVVVGERGFYPTGLKKRVITEIFKYVRREL